MSSSSNPRSSGATVVGQPQRKKRPWWLLALLAVLIVVVLLLLLARCGKDDSTTGSAGSTSSGSGSSGSASVTPSASASASGSASGSPSGSATNGGAGAGRLTAGGKSLLAQDASAGAGSLSTYDGRSARARGVRVQSVPADEGFWAGPSASDRVWVQIKGSGESPYHVRKGDAVDFRGKVVANPAGFAQRVGVSSSEGAQQLTREKSHVQVKQGGVTLAKG